MELLDFSQFLVLGAVIAGVTELINRLRAKDYWVAATVLTAAIIGGIFGALDYYENMDILTGVATGFGVSGAFSAIGMIRGKSTPAESTVLGPKTP